MSGPVAAASGADVVASFSAASTRVRRDVPFSAAVWRATDPGSGIMTAPVLVEGLEADGCAVYWECEARETGPFAYANLARRSLPVTGLAATGGDGAAATPLFREYLRPRGLGDELRGVLRLGHGLWGSLSLFRLEDEPPFGAAEVALVGAHLSPLARRLRELAREASAPQNGIGPGVLVLDARSRVVAINDEASKRMDLIDGFESGLARGALPAWVASAAALVRSAGPASTDGVRLRLRTATGGWMMAHASLARTGPDHRGEVAVVLDDARSAETAALVAAAHDLTPREIEVTALICRGLNTTHIAAALVVSPHTVRDHVKSILAKTRVASRGELVALLHAERSDRVEAGTVRLPGPEVR